MGLGLSSPQKLRDKIHFLKVVMNAKCSAQSKGLTTLN